MEESFLFLLLSYAPHPNPLPKGEGRFQQPVLIFEAQLIFEHKPGMAFFVPLFPDGDNFIDGDVANLIFVVL